MLGNACFSYKLYRRMDDYLVLSFPEAKQVVVCGDIHGDFLTLLLHQLSHFARSIVEILHVMFAEMQECYATVFSRTIEPKKDKGREKRKTCQHLQIIRILPLWPYDHPFGERDSWILLIFR